jgi:PKHD-type hydroxylase
MVNYTFPRSENDPLGYYYFEKGFTPEELQWIYDNIEDLEFEKAVILGEDTEGIRNSRIKWIPQNQTWDWLYERLISYAEEANNQLWNFELLTAPEKIQYTEYLATDDGKYGWHQDIGPGIPSLRKVSITVQLSHPDEYEGGDFQMWLGGDPMDESSYITGPKGQGNVIVFPSYLPHQVAPITKGIRRSFVLWVGGEHYK